MKVLSVKWKAPFPGHRNLFGGVRCGSLTPRKDRESLFMGEEGHLDYCMASLAVCVCMCVCVCMRACVCVILGSIMECRLRWSLLLHLTDLQHPLACPVQAVPSGGRYNG